MIAAILFAAAVASAPDPESSATAATPAVTPTPAVADANKVICHNEEVTGSRLGNVRVCMTKAQWDERSAADRQNFESTLNSNNATAPH